MTRSRVCPDTEPTGLSPASDALLEIAIISDTGVPFLNTLICPPDTFKVKAWLAAQAVHGITPAMFRNELRACAACVGRRQGWPLYHASCAHSVRYGSPRPRPVRENNC
ncbi:3'-5' exonuclease [Salmonella enterica subsp. enterica serovar Minnesota]|nr:3'-5' exonuclease [Salmonella enterica]MCT7027355.1 3'-5' exonuclease [Salmonella enterica subsp. enterica serovar Minnesota]